MMFSIFYIICAVPTFIVAYRVMYHSYVDYDLPWNDRDRVIHSVCAAVFAGLWPFVWVLGLIYLIFKALTPVIKKLEK